jgi:hypothetical protein
LVGRHQPGGGLIASGALVICAGVLALIGRDGSLATQRPFQVLTNLSLIMVGVVLIAYGFA